MNVIHKNVLVQVQGKEVERNGVLLPEDEQVDERLGVVVRYGEGLPEDVKTILNAKPTVKYKEYFDGEATTIDGTDYIVMSYKSILIIL